MNNDQIQRINKHLLFTVPQQKVDVAILLGNSTCSGELARKAAHNYHNGYFENIILCGGVRVFSKHLLTRKLVSDFKQVRGFSSHNFTIPWEDIIVGKKTESQHMHDVLIRNGLPKNALVHIDNDSTNTGENFEFIKDSIKDNGFKTASIFAGAHHARRGVETCEKWIPELTAYPVHVYPFGLKRNEWLAKWSNDRMISYYLTSEFAKTNPENPNNYYDKGFCVPVNMADLLRQPQIKCRI